MKIKQACSRAVIGTGSGFTTYISGKEDCESIYVTDVWLEVNTDDGETILYPHHRVVMVRLRKEKS